jgi:hypothetical protein
LPETPRRQSESEPQPGSAGARTRLLYAGGALAGFGALTAIVLIASGGGDDVPPAEPAPQACLDAWNEDEDALADGRHASGFHGYSRTQVAYISQQGDLLGPDRAPGAECAVIFASNGLDSEPDFAVRTLQEGSWNGINTRVDPSVLAGLQAGAFSGANATLQQAGELEPGAEER